MKRSNKRFNGFKSAKQAGFTLVELLVGITILLAFSSILIFNFSGDRTKTALILESARQYGDAFLRYKSDTGVTPIAMDSLLLKAQNTAADTVEGIAATTVWRGPYVNGFTQNAAGNVKLDSIAAGVVMSISTVPVANLPAGLTSGTQFVFSSIPDAVVRETVASCNGTDPTAALPTNYSTGNKCYGTLAAGAVPGSVNYLVVSK